MINLDQNATTDIDPEVLTAMIELFQGDWGNPSSLHRRGRKARQIIDHAKERIASALGVKAEGIVFTSGATEANNLAILGQPRLPRKVLLGATEHPSARVPAEHLGTLGAEVIPWPVDGEGRLVELSESVVADADLAILQWANSETGVVQDIARHASRLPDSCWLHVDAVQALGRMEVDFRRSGATSMSLSSHKIHGPAGIGALLLRESFEVKAQQLGGSQQQGRRAGTESVVLMEGCSLAIDRAQNLLSESVPAMARCRDRLEESLRSRVSDIQFHGDASNRLPNTTNVSFHGAPADAVLIGLDLAGVCASSGTACASGSTAPSRVLQAMKLDESSVESAIRFCVSRFTREEEMDQAATIIEDVVARVRGASRLRA